MGTQKSNQDLVNRWRSLPLWIRIPGAVVFFSMIVVVYVVWHMTIALLDGSFLKKRR